jgi:hypothetical protein
MISTATTGTPSLVTLMLRRFGQLGTRVIVGCATALIAAVLICASPEIGILGAVGGVFFGGVSAALFHPHFTAKR